MTQQGIIFSAVISDEEGGEAHRITESLKRAARQAALRGNITRADRVELEHIRRTIDTITLRDGEEVEAEPVRLVRGYGPTGRLAVEWCTIDGTRYTDIDGKEF